MSLLSGWRKEVYQTNARFQPADRSLLKPHLCQRIAMMDWPPPGPWSLTLSLMKSAPR
ncbi:Uncharacterised protein [Pluralibacter gergoviae]|nr:Uncharacterised protein [Pluralibacter gergoviae]